MVIGATLWVAFWWGIISNILQKNNLKTVEPRLIKESNKENKDF